MWPIARPVRRVPSLSVCGEIKREKEENDILSLSYNVWNTFDHIKIRPKDESVESGEGGLDT